MKKRNVTLGALVLAGAVLFGAVRHSAQAGGVGPEYQPVQVLPGFIPTSLRKIGSEHLVTGYRPTSNGATRAVVRRAETGAERNLPGQPADQVPVPRRGDGASAVSPDGQWVVGWTEGPAGVSYASRWNAAGELQLIDPPGVGDSSLIGINDNGISVGNGPQGPFVVANNSFVGEPLQLTDGCVQARVNALEGDWAGGYQCVDNGQEVRQVPTLWHLPDGTARVFDTASDESAITAISRMERSGGEVEYAVLGYSVVDGDRQPLRWDLQGNSVSFPGRSLGMPVDAAGKWCVLDDGSGGCLLIDLQTGEVFVIGELLKVDAVEGFVVVSVSEDGCIAIVIFLPNGAAGGIAIAKAGAAEELPDLVPSFEGVTFLPSSNGRGLTMRGFLRVTNAGKKKSGASRLRMYLSSDGALDVPGDRRLKNFTVPPLQPGQFKNYRIVQVLPRGTVAAFGIADATGVVRESEEGNNIATRTTR